ncbi:efflux RND transporter periplasmic adaptor subunit [Pseudoalteromonas xiamenensis]|uniref:efflux RND transporter periplasmic adaptor subunit n=1 Tax=Pseudoalteromonas xiamenensis TaxID=882626 RepID=UPI0027E53AEB|nr:efflux RND transporter periplasmic adaptor subunit [Pseudoalteromonas xiamenensis]WMN59574.1 efflux RND transporter periplasmic adaptor subunit [Pseudoalteromonas xiamenensis]
MKYFYRLLLTHASVLGVVTLLMGCEPSDQYNSKPVSRPVKLFAVGSGHIQKSLRYPGSVSAVKQSVLAFEVPGKIIDVRVNEGDLVEAGDVLATLDARDYQAQLERAETEKDIAKLDFERFSAALKANAVTTQAYEQAKSAFEVAESGLTQAKKALDDTRLIAPFSGRITSKEIEQFATVYAKQPVMHIHSDTELEMVVEVPEVDWAKGRNVRSAREIKLEDQLFVEVSALPNERFDGQITEFSGKADSITRTFKVTVGFSSTSNLSISPGMTGHVLYQPKNTDGKEGALYIPVDAVLGETDSSPFVWRLDNETGAVYKTPVELGAISADLVEVKQGLEKGDRIATSGLSSLRNGALVHALEG